MKIEFKTESMLSYGKIQSTKTSNECKTTVKLEISKQKTPDFVASYTYHFYTAVHIECK